jgi:hypothetical protein
VLGFTPTLGQSRVATVMLVSNHNCGDFYAISKMCVCVGFVVFVVTRMKSCKEEKKKTKHQEQDDKPNKQHREMEKKEKKSYMTTIKRMTTMR